MPPSWVRHSWRVASCPQPEEAGGIAAARTHGCLMVDGVEMLVQLAMQIFERWTGVVPEEAVFKKAVAEALGE